ncbi:nucleotidyltransferase family protein [Blastococcus sp. SYSU D00820]
MPVDVDDRVRSLLLDHACGEVVRHLEGAGHEVIVLKGDTIASWLYPDPGARTYRDLDLLVSPEAESAVVRSLAELGYRQLFSAAWRATQSPEEQPLQDHRGVDLDLHVTIKGIGVPPRTAWDVLSHVTVPWSWRGTSVRALAPHARALHLALHVAQRGLADDKAARDLALGLARVDTSTWRAAAQLAERLEAVETFSAGLRLVPEGEALARDLGLPEPRRLETRMRADSATNAAVVLQRTLDKGTWAQRIRFAAIYVFPPRAWWRLMYPEEARTPWTLARARLRRPFTLLHRLPAAVRARRRYRPSP